MAKKIEFVEVEGSTSVHIDVEIDQAGDLVFSGQDIGDAPREIFGDSDYWPGYMWLIHAEAPDFGSIGRCLRPHV